MDKVILVVRYNTTISDSSTIRSLFRCRGHISPTDLVIVWDNSLDRAPADDISLLKKELPCEFEYIHTPQNLPLSHIYNQAAVKCPDIGLLILLDQDSTIDTGYFSGLEHAARSHPEINLFVPLIRHGDLIVSPGRYNGFKGKYWALPQTGLVSAAGNTAVASGMAIRGKYAKEFGGFEEGLSLYGIDTNFMVRYAQTNQYFYVLDTDFSHDLSDFNAEAPEIKRKRFKEFAHGTLVNARLYPFHIRLLARIYIWWKYLQLKHAKP